MSKRYDIVSSLHNANERPVIAIAEGFEVTVNNSKTTALMIQAIAKDESIDEGARMDKMLQAALGKDAAKQIEKLELSFTAYGILIEAVMAAIGGEELAETATRFPDKE